MSGKRVRRTRNTGWGFLVTVAALAAVVALLGWWVVRLVTDDEVLPAADAPIAAEGSSGGSGANDDAADGTSDGASDGTSGAGDAGALLEQCATQLVAVEDAVAAARPGIASWREHTQARTDMLADRISEKRMEAIYERTQHAGHAAQPRFTEAVEAVEEPRPCQGLQALEDAGADDQAAGCLERSETAAAALDAAEATMEEWGAHLHHMDDYDDGGMSTGKAMKLWVTAWRKAPEGLEAYADRTAALRDAPACTTG